MPGLAHARDELVHDSDAGADKGILSLAAEFGDLGKRQMHLALTHQRESRGNFDGCGRTESSTDRDFAMHKQVRSLRLKAALHQDAGDTEHVVTPCAGALGGKVVEVKLEVASELFGVNHQLTIGSRGDGHVGREGDGCRHDETVVVIGVFANQIHASGGAEYPGPIAEECFEVPREFAGSRCHWNLHARMPMQNGSCGSSTNSASAFTKAAPLMLG